jgi:ligand-binding sensor domain-containing protein
MSALAVSRSAAIMSDQLEMLILGAREDVRWLNQSMRRVQWPGVSAYKKTGG